MRYNPDILNRYYNGPWQTLYALPDLPQSPEVYTPSKDYLILFPLFYDDCFNKQDTRHAFTRLAMWARHSWLINSDITDFNIEAKFYIDRTLLTDIYSTLKNNHITDNDIIAFDSKTLLGYNLESFPRLSRKLFMLIDPALTKYKNVISMDTDLLCCSQTEAKLPFIKNIIEANLPNTIALAENLYRGPTETYKDELRKLTDEEAFYKLFQWQIDNAVAHCKDEHATLEDNNKFFRDRLDGFGLTDYYISDKTPFPYNNFKSWMIYYPTQYYHEYEHEFIEFAKDFFPYFADDESFLSVWQFKSQEQLTPLLSTIRLLNRKIDGGAHTPIVQQKMDSFAERNLAYIYHGKDIFQAFDKFRTYMYKNLKII